MPSGGTTWYYRPTNSARYPRSPKPGLVDQAFMTELRPTTQNNGTLRTPRGGIVNTPRGGGVGDNGTTPRGGGTPRGIGTPRQDGRLDMVSSDAYKQYLTRISRPTIASRFRFDSPAALSFSYSHRTQSFDQRYLWNRLPVLEDSYRCLWSRHGAVKEGTKLGLRSQNI